jgi:hypothetical protein
MAALSRKLWTVRIFVEPARTAMPLALLLALAGACNGENHRLGGNYSGSDGGTGGTTGASGATGFSDGSGFSGTAGSDAGNDEPRPQEERDASDDWGPP